MQAELAEVTTADGVTLEGAFFGASQERGPWSTIDAFLLVHSSGTTFRNPFLISLIQRLRDHGYPCAAFNNTGHDIVWSPPGDGAYWGNAFEVLDRCRLDLRAMTDWLANRGLRRIALVGHGMGGVKVVYYPALEQDPNVAAVVSISPVRLSYSFYMNSPDELEFRRTYARARHLIQSGRGHELMRVTFPIPHIFNVRAYVDKHGPDEKYNLVKYVDHLSCPLLVMGGTLETHTRLRDFPAELVNKARHRNVPAELAMVEGANHTYTGMEDAVATRVLTWVDSLSGPANAAVPPVSTELPTASSSTQSHKASTG